MEQLYGDFDASYNKLHAWIVVMWEHSDVPWRSVYCIRHIATNFYRDYKNADWQRQVVRMVYELEPHIFGKRLLDLRVTWRVIRTHFFDNGWVPWSHGNGLKVSAKAFAMVGYLDAKNGAVPSQPDGGGTRVCQTCQECYGCKSADGEVDECRSIFTRCDCRRFQTLHYSCEHVVAACAKVLLNSEQFIDEVYTLKRTLRVWENEFPVLPDLSTWEVPPTTFELVLDKRLRKNLKGHSQSSRIHNEMDIREKSNGKLCGVCRLTGRNRSKCLLYHFGQSLQSGRN
ncbi:hypothetical protein GOBAR_DD14114 [Gossypium barbadense]|nr:hypothetical protein GOBAR_DD14114 [Gossypium barbadense]